MANSRFIEVMECVSCTRFEYDEVLGRHREVAFSEIQKTLVNVDFIVGVVCRGDDSVFLRISSEANAMRIADSYEDIKAALV